jgi:hypothetical protein
VSIPEPEPDQPEELKTPFSFKLMIALTVVYLGYRLVQGVVWVIGQIRG